MSLGDAPSFKIDLISFFEAQSNPGKSWFLISYKSSVNGFDFTA